MGQSVIYHKLGQDNDIKIKLDNVVLDLEKHGRSILNDNATIRLISNKLQPFRQRKQIYISRDNINNVSVITVDPKFKIVQTKPNRIKIFNSY